MIRDNYLDISRITADPGVLKIFKIIRGYGGVVRFVGGAGRDAPAGAETARWSGRRTGCLKSHGRKPGLTSVNRG